MAVGMLQFDKVEKEQQRLLSVSLPLIGDINKKVEDPVVVCTSWFVGQFCEADHLCSNVERVGQPAQASRPDVCFGKSYGGDGNHFGNETLLVGMDNEAKGCLPILSGDFADGQYVVLVVGHISLFPRARRDDENLSLRNFMGCNTLA